MLIVPSPLQVAYATESEMYCSTVEKRENKTAYETYAPMRQNSATGASFMHNVPVTSNAMAPRRKIPPRTDQEDFSAIGSRLSCKLLLSAGNIQTAFVAGLIQSLYRDSDTRRPEPSLLGGGEECAPEKKGLCHRTDDPSFFMLSLSLQAKYPHSSDRPHRMFDQHSLIPTVPRGD